ncbi:alpha mating-type protein MAT1-1-1 [Talaromyces proteolyticus]|uniref:Alpha mating-type protein MAT1-1-1 n=1 Tax=Talaromyces proteolyticus TaxID=1131652 RepID=A0AAD4KY73_9EURO|nr:alpha mating-type protein MAT1-1-1 [Talaromyces proteolyticus]KAH8703735.1 alpha mating-type protein MAT1-1-1 [Talaromyces proteolyticus]
MPVSYSAQQGLDPLQRAFNMFILNLPTGDLNELISFARHSSGKEQPFAENSILRQAGEVLKSISLNDDGHGMPQSPSVSSRSSRSKNGTEKKLRPLNSFIAYRSFYSTMFTDMTQKSKSGIIKYLWQIDPYKGKWAILAKAYSILRDDHSDNVSLDTFLDLMVPFIGLIQPASYLEAMGCQIITTADQQYQVQSISSTGPDASNSATNYSVADIVNHCYECGYIKDSPCAELPDDTTQVPFAAKPTIFPIQTDQAPINLDDVNRIVQDTELSRPVDAAMGQTIKSYLSVNQPVRTQYELFKIIDGAVVDLSEANAGDPDFYAPFNPAVQAFPTFDPMANDPFDPYNINEMDF